MKKKLLLFTLVVTLFIGAFATPIAAFSPRTTVPATSNTYFFSTANPFYPSLAPYPGTSGRLGNCTWYAWGRAYEILGTRPNLCIQGAGSWFQYNKSNGIYPYGSTPKVGAIACYSSHVAVVEEIKNGNVYVSESSWGSDNYPSFLFQYNNINWNNSNLGLQGYIYLPVSSAPPSNVKLTASKTNCKVNTKITLTPSSVGASHYCISILNSSGGKVYSNANFKSAITWTPTKADIYTAWISAINASGFADSPKIKIKVDAVKPSNVQLIADPATCKVNETIKLRPSAVGATYYCISILDSSGTKVYSNANFQYAINWTPKKADTYTAWISALNAVGFDDSPKIKIKVDPTPKPWNVQFIADPANCKVNQTIKLRPSAVGASYYCVSIFDSSGARAYYNANFQYAINWTPTKADTYTAWISAFNSAGFADSPKIKIKVDAVKPSNVQLIADPANCKIGETMELRPASVGATYYSLSILDSSGTKVYSDANLQNAITWTPTKADTYTAWISAINAVGSADSPKIQLNVSDRTTPVTGITLDETELTMEEGNAELVVASVLPADATDKTVVWSSSDGSVATVANGRINALKAGETDIVATTQDGGFSATCKVTVVAKTPPAVPVSGVVLNKGEMALTEGGAETLTATVAPSDASNKEVIWDSADVAVATVENGVITAKGAGQTIITVTTKDGSKTDICKVTVKAAAVEPTPDPDPDPNPDPTPDPKPDPDPKPNPDPTPDPTPSPNPDPNPFRFDDVKDNKAFYYDAVYWAVNHQPQITKGLTDTTFGAGETCTRAQVVTFLWRAKGQPEPKSANNPFTDVKSSDYFYKAVLWAVENGVTEGMTKTSFGPKAGCTRGQVVTFLHRAEGKPAAAGKNVFTDVKAGAYYYDAVLWAVGREITNGTDATHFSPEKTCTRGQIVTFLYRDLK